MIRESPHGKTLARRLVVLPVFAAFILVSCAVPVANNAAALAGRWKNVSRTFYFSDGTTASGPTQIQCWVEFGEHRVISECVSERGTDRIVYAYHLLGPQRYESEIVEHKNLPNLVGTRIPTDFRIEDGRLFTTAHPPEINTGGSRFVIKVESTWARE